MHVNKAPCPGCTQILARYSYFDKELGMWFTDLQYKHPEAHVSCAGRGRIDQEQAFFAKTSNAHWLESAHNYNMALEIFRMLGRETDYNRWWFASIMKDLPDWIEWYGAPGAEYPELPHVQRRDWKRRKLEGTAFQVEI